MTMQTTEPVIAKQVAITVVDGPIGYDNDGLDTRLTQILAEYQSRTTPVPLLSYRGDGPGGFNVEMWLSEDDEYEAMYHACQALGVTPPSAAIGTYLDRLEADIEADKAAS